MAKKKETSFDVLGGAGKTTGMGYAVRQNVEHGNPPVVLDVKDVPGEAAKDTKKRGVKKKTK
jgi:hypothetical protein